MKLAPSILNANLGFLAKEINLLENHQVDYIHVDIMDGQFVPNISFGSNIVTCLKSLTKIPLDVHLMVNKPEKQVNQYIDAGADSITVHVESTSRIHNCIQVIKDSGIRVGVAINPETSIDSIKSTLPLVDTVLVMTVNPGKGGQSFIFSMLEKVKDLHRIKTENDYHFEIEVDGGINGELVKRCSEAGVDTMVIGSYIFSANDPGRRLFEIENLITTSCS